MLQKPRSLPHASKTWIELRMMLITKRKSSRTQLESSSEVMFIFQPITVLFLTRSIFSAAADTTLSGIQTFFAAMLCYPEVQKKAQDELDRVLGGRLPEFDDEVDLPYLSAVVKETIRYVVYVIFCQVINAISTCGGSRWKPATPIGNILSCIIQ